MKKVVIVLYFIIVLIYLFCQFVLTVSWFDFFVSDWVHFIMITQSVSFFLILIFMSVGMIYVFIRIINKNKLLDLLKSKIKIIMFFVFCLCFLMYVYDKKNMIDMNDRVDYIALLIKEYYDANGCYPDDVRKILDVYYSDNMMFDTKDIPGKGKFIIYQMNFEGNIEEALILGDWNPSNIIYFPKKNKKEANVDYFQNGSFNNIGIMFFLIPFVDFLSIFSIFIMFFMITIKSDSKNKLS